MRLYSSKIKVKFMDPNIAGFTQKRMIIFYLIITSLIFVYFVRSAPPLIHDQLLYYTLATNLVNNNFNIFITNFDNRAFVFPTFLAFFKIIFSLFGQGSNLMLFYFVNLILFHASNFFIFKSINNKLYGSIFILLSSLNVINLGFTNVLLTETLVVFLITSIFYLLLNLKQLDCKWIFTFGILNSLYVYTRPNAFVPFLLIVFYVVIKEFMTKKYLNVATFLTGCLTVFSIGIANTYITTSKLAFFTEDVFRSSLTKYPPGIVDYKFEGSIDNRFESPEMRYTNVRNLRFNKDCTSILDCPIYYLKQAPQEYAGMLLTHLFALFDRVYLDLYIDDIFAVNNILRFLNYFVISGVILYLLFLQKDLRMKFFIKLSVIIIFANILPFLPTMVEARYSAPLYPIILALFCIYLIALFKLKILQRIKFILAQSAIILFFFLISNQVLDSLYIG